MNEIPAHQLYVVSVLQKLLILFIVAILKAACSNFFLEGEYAIIFSSFELVFVP